MHIFRYLHFSHWNKEHTQIDPFNGQFGRKGQLLQGKVDSGMLLPKLKGQITNPQKPHRDQTCKTAEEINKLWALFANCLPCGGLIQNSKKHGGLYTKAWKLSHKTTLLCVNYLQPRLLKIKPLMAFRNWENSLIFSWIKLFSENGYAWIQHLYRRKFRLMFCDLNAYFSLEIKISIFLILGQGLKFILFNSWSRTPPPSFLVAYLVTLVFELNASVVFALFQMIICYSEVRLFHGLEKTDIRSLCCIYIDNRRLNWWSVDTVRFWTVEFDTVTFFIWILLLVTKKVT